MSLRLSLFALLAAAACAKQAPQVRAPHPAPRPMFDLSRICDDPHYRGVCSDTQSPITPASFPTRSPIRVDTNLATPPSTTFGLQG